MNLYEYLKREGTLDSVVNAALSRGHVAEHLREDARQQILLELCQAEVRDDFQPRQVANYGYRLGLTAVAHVNTTLSRPVRVTRHAVRKGHAATTGSIYTLSTTDARGEKPDAFRAQDMVTPSIEEELYGTRFEIEDVSEDMPYIDELGEVGEMVKRLAMVGHPGLKAKHRMLLSLMVAGATKREILEELGIDESRLGTLLAVIGRKIAQITEADEREQLAACY